MTTENEEWKPRNRYYENGQQSEDGQNRERRPYQSYNRTSYGNKPGNYNRQGGNFERQGGNYDRQGGNYDRQRYNSYDRQGTGNYDRQGGNYNNNWGNNQDRRENGSYYPKPQQRSYENYQRPYDNQQRNYDNQPRNYDNRSQDSGDANPNVKKRRPRVGEVPIPTRNTNYSRQGGNYNNPRPGGYQQQQQPWSYNNYPNRNAAPNRNRPGGNRMPYNPDAKYSLRKQLKYREENFDPNEPIRLNKYLANAGVCSRREADEFIQAGLVKVNGETVSELGTKVKRSDLVAFHNETVKLEQKIYVLLNKPKNCVTTADDPQERLTVMDLVKTACQERIFPVGRLDRNTTGVLLLTNDGDLASKLTHPKFLKKKIYHVWLDKNVSVDDMQKLAEGVDLEDGEIHADAVSYVTEIDKDQVGIEIHSGRNRVVRRMFEALGYHVMRLDRVYFAGLTKKNLKRGQWRYLNEKEVAMLRMGAFD
ncbi:MAG: RNA-binding S4 domain-containing protein [Candidatus Symbiothrix sp.]|jgi:23S rRNA pseudouridine2605 synthase|nr:RNA-binding S4 domain-containing protein [Candidatus Symbiothrix sp.]